MSCNRPTFDLQLAPGRGVGVLKFLSPPTDSRLLNRAREQLVDEAKANGIVLRQSYARIGPRAEQQAGRYAHAKQYRRMRGQLRKLRGWLGRVIRDVERKAAESMPQSLAHKLALAKRLHRQRRDDTNKLYALHAPEVECLAKGKARTPHEFSVKVSVAVTAKEGLVVGMRSMPGNPYDGHKLANAIEQVEILMATTPSIVLADRGYRGVKLEGDRTRLILSHTRKLAPALKRLLKRRQVVEPMIGHMKADGLLDRNWLKGELGDSRHAVMCGAGHNLRMILARLRALYCLLIAVLLNQHHDAQRYERRNTEPTTAYSPHHPTPERASAHDEQQRTLVTLRKAYGYRTFRIAELSPYHVLGKLPEPRLAHRFF